MKVGPTPLSPPAGVDRGGPVSAAHDPHQATLARLLPARHAGAGPHPSGTLRVRATLPPVGRSSRRIGIALTLALAGLDVDAKARELGREAGVLAVPPDRQRELRTRHQHGGCTGASVDRDRLRL